MYTLVLLSTRESLFNNMQKFQIPYNAAQPFCAPST